MKPILTAKNLTKSYANGILALNKVSFTLDQGKVLVVMGPVSYTHLRAHET